MSIGRFVFHVGAPKTGTSLLQKALRRLTGPLAEHGVTYVDRSRWLEMDTYRGWAPYGRDHISPGDFQNELRRVFDDAGGAEGDLVVTSNEAASGWDSDLGIPFWKDAHDAVRQVVEALEPDSTEIVVYLRRQDRFLESLYMELVHIGRAIEWDEFRDAACKDDRVRFSELIDAVGAVDGVDRVHVRLFESIRSGAREFVADFLELVDAGRLAHGLADEVLEVARPSFTQPAWEAALRLNHLVTSPEEIRRLRRFLVDLFPTEQYPAASLLTESERAHLVAEHREDNERVFSAHLPDLPLTTYSTVDAIEGLDPGTWIRPRRS
jgi:hypothetical protein